MTDGARLTTLLAAPGRAIKAVVFDLDDTLYLEWEFTRGGFAAVADELESRQIGVASEIATVLESLHLREGRDHVLDRAAERIPFPRAWVPELVARFRDHAPSIRLFPDVVEVLPRLREHYRLGCITDGHAEVQRRKLDALQLRPMLDTIVIADELGRAHWKPSLVAFETCCRQLGRWPSETVFVGDNPDRDIRGAHAAGLATVLIHRVGAYPYEAAASAGDRPDYEVAGLRELENLLARSRVS